MSPNSTSTHNKLIREFAITDGLIRATGLFDFVVYTASFALLPGFGVYGLFISNSIQDFATAILEIPLGIAADRFGWSRIVKISQFLKCIVAISLFLGVYYSWKNDSFLTWFFVAAHGVIDAVVHSMLHGAYEAAYLERYRKKLTEAFGVYPPDSPPLFVKSLQIANGMRLVIPFLIIPIIYLLQYLLNFPYSEAYGPSLISFGIIIVLRIIIYLKIRNDLSDIANTAGALTVERPENFILTPLVLLSSTVRKKPAIFFLYTFAAILHGVAASYVVAIAITHLDTIMRLDKYNWLTGVVLILLIYVFDSIYWMWVGHRMNSDKAISWIRNISFALLFTNLISLSFEQLEIHPIFQLIGLSLSAFMGILCAGSIKRYFASHLRDWIKTDYVATWFSVAETISVLCLALIGVGLVFMNDILPHMTLLLLISSTLSIGIVYHLKPALTYQT